MEMMAQIERIGMIPPEGRPIRSATMPPPPDVRPSEPLTSAVDKWLANCSGKNGARTVDAKAYHIKDFLALAFGSVASVETSFHSFRVNVVTELHNKNANAAKVMTIVGHDDGGGHDVHWGYVRELPDCKEIVDMLDWPIGLAALRYDGGFAGFLADRNNWAAEPAEVEAPKA